MTISGPEPLTPAHKLDGFSCGKPSLDRWLKTRALSNQDRGFTAVIVVHVAQGIGTGLLKHARSAASRRRA